MNPIKLTFRIHLDAEYHSGSGRRAGAEIDSGLLRDEENSPVLRGTLLAGLLRDGLRDLLKMPPANKLEARVNDPWGAETRLFGAAHLRKRWHYSSARPENPAHQDYWNVQPVARISIDPRTRRARQQALFTQEEGDRRLKFLFTATCHAGDEQDKLDALLLVAAGRTVRHLGSARRRGRGACRFELIKAEGLPEVGAAPQVDALNAFRKHWLDAPVANVKSHTDAPPTNETVAAPTAEQVAKFEADLLEETIAPVHFKIFVRFDEPVLIAQSAQLANAFLTRNDVPGGVLLGAFAALAARTLKLQPFDREKFYQPAPLEFIRLFMRGGVLCSGLGLAKLTGTGQRFNLSLPVPLDHYVCEKYPRYNKKIREPHPLAVSTLHGSTPAEKSNAIGKCRRDGCDGKLSRIGEPWLALTSQPLGFEPARREEAHIKMDPDLGRVEEGNLFEYIPLEAGQFYAGELVFKTEDDWREFQRLTGLHEGRVETIHLGKAAQRGYGNSALYLQRCDDRDKPSAMLPMKIAERFSLSEVQKNGFRLMLLTDAIIPDPWGRYYHSFDAAWIAELFDLKPEHIEYDGIEGSHEELHGFHGQRRIPRWRDHVISAGSCMGIKMTQEGWQQLEQNALRHREASAGLGEEKESASIPTANANKPEAQADDSLGFSWLLERLEHLEKHGIGLRRHEGFGRVVFNHPIYGSNREKFEIRWELPSQLYQVRGKESLLDEFKRRWSSKLDKIESEKVWKEKLDAHSLPVAQTIYLRRFQSKENLEAALDRLLKPDAVYLWGKQLPLRKEEIKSKVKIADDLTKLIRGAIEELFKDAGKNHQDPRWPEGLAMLAERIAENAGE